MWWQCFICWNYQQEINPCTSDSGRSQCNEIGVYLCLHLCLMTWSEDPLQGKLEGCQHTDTLFRDRTYRISVFQDGAQASIIINYLVILMCHKVWRYLSALQQVSFQTPRQHIPHCMTTTRYLYELCCRQHYQGTWITRESWEYNNINNTVENRCKNLINLVDFTKHPK